MIFDDYYIFNTEQKIIKFINKFIKQNINNNTNKNINNALIYSKIYKSYKKYNCIYDKNIMDVILLNE